MIIFRIKVVLLMALLCLSYAGLGLCGVVAGPIDFWRSRWGEFSETFREGLRAIRRGRRIEPPTITKTLPAPTGPHLVQ